jgi:hypothetical protein
MGGYLSYMRIYFNLLRSILCGKLPPGSDPGSLLYQSRMSTTITIGAFVKPL